MSSILDEWIALDTNVYLIAVRGFAGSEDCQSLLCDNVERLRIHLPLQIIVELNDNLTEPHQQVEQFEALGTKKGDAALSANLHSAKVSFLISENRHFLREVSGLPFEVLSASEALSRLEIGA